MGLIKAALGAARGTMADQWKEFFYCESLDQDVLMVRGKKQTGKRSSNTKGHDNVITSGSGIAVADGQCMMIVEQGKIVEVCAEPGEYTYDSSSEPSIFSGDLGQGIVETFYSIGKRFTFGGDTGKDQRVYYFNMKEIMDNKFGTANPFLFRVVDQNIGLDLDVQVRCNGIYSYRITNPLVFYTNVCGNVSDVFERETIDHQLKTEFISALQPAFAKLSDLELRPSQIPAHATELEDAMNDVLNRKWAQQRGISIVSVAMNPITLREEDLQKIQEKQDMAVLRDPSMMAATLGGAQAEAMKAAASNPNGAMMGFMGMNMAGGANGVNLQNLYEMGNAQQKNALAAAVTKQDTGVWTCSCGAENTGKFCMECGQPKPQEAKKWICHCGTHNTGKFCTECGQPRPVGKKHCTNCGWEVSDPGAAPKFCPECGTPLQ